MINAIIIDDEPAARASLGLEIKLHCPQINILAEASSVAEGVEVVRNNPKADLLFLDIQLTDGSGFDLLQQIDFESLKIYVYHRLQRIRASRHQVCSPGLPTETHRCTGIAGGG